jgi:hypothetical protein
MSHEALFGSRSVLGVTVVVAQLLSAGVYAGQPQGAVDRKVTISSDTKADAETQPAAQAKAEVKAEQQGKEVPRTPASTRSGKDSGKDSASDELISDDSAEHFRQAGRRIEILFDPLNKN